MAITSDTSVDLYLDDIAAEFGGVGDLYLDNYYRGGGLVPDSAVNAGIPVSGDIFIDQFYGASNIVQQPFTVTEGVSAGKGSSSFGFSNSVAALSYGAISPTTLKGVAIRDARFDTTPSGFLFSVSGSLPADFFIRLLPQDGVWLTSASASHSESLGITFWQWLGVSKPARWDGSGTSTLIIEH